jgi:hypothetical protein
MCLIIPLPERILPVSSFYFLSLEKKFNLNFSLPFIGGLFAYLGFKKEKVLASLLLHHKESYTPTISKEKFSTTTTLITT